MSAQEVGAIYNAGANGKIKQTAFTAQTNVKIAAATISFPSAQNGMAAEQVLDGAGLPAITDGTPKLYYHVSADVSTTDASFYFDVAALAAGFPNLRVLHLENGICVNRTAASNTLPNLWTTALS